MLTGSQAEKQAEINRQNSPLAFLSALGTAIIEAQPEIIKQFKHNLRKLFLVVQDPVLT